MNNRETVGLSPDACNPEGKNDNRQRQRHTDHFHRRIIPAAGRHGRFSGRGRGGNGFTHVYAIGAFSSEVDTGSREENASKQKIESRSNSFGTEQALEPVETTKASG